MPPRDAHELYKGSLLHKIFAVGSVLFLLGVIWIVVADHTREWKYFQREFEAFERDQTTKAIERAQRKVDTAGLERLTKELAGKEEELKARRQDFAAAKNRVNQVNTKLFKVNQGYQIAKSYYDSAKYSFEEAVKHEHGVDAPHAELERTEAVAEPLRLEKEKLEVELAEAEKSLGLFTQARDDLEKERLKLTRDRDQLQKKLDQLKPSLVKMILNAPILDFIKPTLKIEQVVLDELHDDLHFVKVPKVDRCTTCHLAIDKAKGYDKAPQPFRSHPRLDLFLAAASAHPVEEFGCTTCHGGSGQDVTFIGAAHTPRSGEQKEEWVKKYGWHERAYWENPMLAIDRVEAGCVKCHSASQEIPAAPKINAGRRLFREVGCFGCHETKGFEGLRKVGPSLERISNKTDRGWVFRWIRNPLAYNPTTRMPRFFGLSNAASSEQENVEIDAVVTYLFHHSKEIELAKPSDRGDAVRGKELVDQVGCLGCHSIGESTANHFGPNLSWVGSKVNRAWLTDWLKNPKHYWAETRMPDFRLSDKEVLDIAEYLLTLRNPEFDQLAEPVMEADQLRQAALYELQLQMPQSQASERISVMDENAMKLYLGERVIQRYGCYGCHDIAGFENAKPIGTSLSEEGSKTLSLFDFGLLDIEHSHESWFHQKLKDPRSFDRGKVKRHEERLRMPEFNLIEEEIQSLITHTMSLTKEEVPLSKRHILDAWEEKAEAGWRIVREFNCQGCHIIGGEGGSILELYEGKSLGPPDLTGEGKKVQSDWLFNFLRHPATIRPWLTIRMPTFSFSDERAAKLVKFFHGLDNVEDAFEPDDKLPVSSEELAVGKHIFESLQCIKCHRFTEGMVIDESVDVSTLAPNLSMARQRLRPDWVVEWLKDPESLMPGTRMPSFWPDDYAPLPDVLGGDAELQRKAVRSYVVNLANESVTPSSKG